MKNIDRKEYMDFLIRLKDKQIIKVISGVRRCGKSTLFKIYRDYLLENEVLLEQIISINFEDLDYEEYTDYKTVEKYIKGLTDSLILYEVKRYDIKSKQFLANLSKYYIVDIALRQLLLTNKSSDMGHILENIVYLELLRRGYEVYAGVFKNAEIDFVAVNNEEINYYQVFLTVLDEKTLARELRPLQEISDNHSKYLITLDEILPNSNYDGIKRLNAIEWLLKTD